MQILQAETAIVTLDKIFKRRKTLVFVCQYDFILPADFVKRPGNGEVGVVPADTTVIFAIELLGALVTND